jgi:hypothetical protein
MIRPLAEECPSPDREHLIMGNVTVHPTLIRDINSLVEQEREIIRAMVDLLLAARTGRTHN